MINSDSHIDNKCEISWWILIYKSISVECITTIFSVYYGVLLNWRAPRTVSSPLPITESIGVCVVELHLVWLAGNTETLTDKIQHYIIDNIYRLNLFNLYDTSLLPYICKQTRLDGFIYWQYSYRLIDVMIWSTFWLVSSYLFTLFTLNC